MIAEAPYSIPDLAQQIPTLTLEPSGEIFSQSFEGIKLGSLELDFDAQVFLGIDVDLGDYYTPCSASTNIRQIEINEINLWDQGAEVSLTSEEVEIIKSAITNQLSI